ncbi:unnamed protein product [Albugo candida]|uniref:Uncharacterized protein n=1 Tax=Albugo candida TaxID=65357 RepID=A0A024G7V5_9STRA|nr:unnamed protein product [Albugo candida]|eukprot:CCI42931.1 unnamed protein product [Albugo candida]
MKITDQKPNHTQKTDYKQQKEKELMRLRTAKLVITNSVNERLRHEAEERKKKIELKYLDQKIRERNRVLYYRRMIPTSDKKVVVNKKEETTDFPRERKPMVPRFKIRRKREEERSVRQKSDDGMKSQSATECTQKTSDILGLKEGIIERHKEQNKAKNRQVRKKRKPNVPRESEVERSRQKPSEETLKRRQRAREAMKLQRKRRQENIAKERQSQIEAKQRLQAKLEQLEKVRLIQLQRSKKYKLNEHPLYVMDTCKEEVAPTSDCLVHSEVDFASTLMIDEKVLSGENHGANHLETESKQNEVSRHRVDKLKELQERASLLSAQLDQLRASGNRRNVSCNETGNSPEKVGNQCSAGPMSKKAYDGDSSHSSGQDDRITEHPLIVSPVRQRCAESSQDVIEKPVNKVEDSVTLVDLNGAFTIRTSLLASNQSYSSPHSAKDASESVSELSLSTDLKMSTNTLLQFSAHSVDSLKLQNGFKFSLKNEADDPLEHLLKQENDSLSVFDYYARELYDLQQQTRVTEHKREHSFKDPRDTAETIGIEAGAATLADEAVQGFSTNELENLKATKHNEDLKITETAIVKIEPSTGPLLETKFDDVRSVEATTCIIENSSSEDAMKKSDRVVHLDVSELDMQKTMQQRSYKVDQLKDFHHSSPALFSPDTLSKHLLAAVEFRDHIHEAQLKVCLLEKTRELEQAQRDTVSYALALKNEVDQNYMQQRVQLEQSIAEKRSEEQLQDAIEKLEMKNNEKSAQFEQEAKRLQEELKRERFREREAQTVDLVRQNPQLTEQDSQIESLTGSTDSNTIPPVSKSIATELEEYDSESFEHLDDTRESKATQNTSTVLENVHSDAEIDDQYSSSSDSQSQSRETEIPSDTHSTSSREIESTQYDRNGSSSGSNTFESEPPKTDETFDSEARSVSEKNIEDKKVILNASIESASDYVDDFDVTATIKSSMSGGSIKDDEDIGDGSKELEASVKEDSVQSYPESITSVTSVSIQDNIDVDENQLQASSMDDFDVPDQMTTSLNAEEQALLQKYLLTVKEGLQREITAIEMFYQAEGAKYEEEQQGISQNCKAVSRQKNVRMQLRAAKAKCSASIAACKAEYYQDILHFQQSLHRGARGGTAKDDARIGVQPVERIDRRQRKEPISSEKEEMLDQDASSNEDYGSFDEVSDEAERSVPDYQSEPSKKSESFIASEISAEEKSIQSVEVPSIQSAANDSQVYDDDDFVSSIQSENVATSDAKSLIVLEEVPTEDSNTTKQLEEQFVHLQSLKMEYSQPNKRISDNKIEQKLQRVEQLIELKKEMLIHERDRLHKEYAYQETDELAKKVLEVDVYSKAREKESDIQFDERVTGLKEDYERLIRSTKLVTSERSVAGSDNHEKRSDISQVSEKSEEIYEADSFEETGEDGPQSEAPSELDEGATEATHATDSHSTNRSIEEVQIVVTSVSAPSLAIDSAASEASEDIAEPSDEDVADKSMETSIYESSFEQSSTSDRPEEMPSERKQTEMYTQSSIDSKSEISEVKILDQAEAIPESLATIRNVPNVRFDKESNDLKEFKGDAGYETSFEEVSASESEKRQDPSSPLLLKDDEEAPKEDLDCMAQVISSQTAQISDQFVACQVAFNESYSVVQELQSSHEPENVSEDSLQAQAERIKSLNILLHEKEKLVRRVHKKIAREREKESLGVEEDKLLQLLGRMEEQLEFDTTILDALRQQNAHSRVDFERRKRKFEGKWMAKANCLNDLLRGYVHVEEAISPTQPCNDVGNQRTSTFSLDRLIEFDFVESAVPPNTEASRLEQSTQTSSTYPTIAGDTICDQDHPVASLKFHVPVSVVSESLRITEVPTPIDHLGSFDHVEDVEPVEASILSITDDTTLIDQKDTALEHLSKNPITNVTLEQEESVLRKEDRAQRISAHLFAELHQETLSEFVQVELTLRSRERLSDLIHRLLRNWIAKYRCTKASVLTTHISTILITEAITDHLLIERMHARPSIDTVAIPEDHSTDRILSLSAFSNDWSPMIIKRFGKQFLANIHCGSIQDCDTGLQEYAAKDVAHSAIKELVSHGMKEGDWIRVAENAEYVSTQRFLLDEALTNLDPCEQYEAIWSQAKHIPNISDFLLYWLSQQVLPNIEPDESQQYGDVNFLQKSNFLKKRSLSLLGSQHLIEERGLTKRLTDALMVDMIEECLQ